MLSWLSILSVDSFPEDVNRRRELAREALARLDEVAARLNAGPLSTEDVLTLSRKIRPREILTREQLMRPNEFLRWLWPLHEVGSGISLGEVLSPSPPRLFHRLITEARSDMPPLEGEEVDEWIHLGNAGDAHQDLFWDPTVTDRVRLLWTDNREEDVVMHDWRAEEYLVQRLFPRLVERWRDDAREYTQPEDSGGLDGTLIFGAVMLAFVAIIGGLFWLVSR